MAVDGIYSIWSRVEPVPAWILIFLTNSRMEPGQPDLYRDVEYNSISYAPYLSGCGEITSERIH
jgi:hypothetical protein